MREGRRRGRPPRGPAGGRDPAAGPRLPAAPPSERTEIGDARETSVDPKLARLHARAREVASALRRANDELPPDFPVEAARRLAESLTGLDDSGSVDQRRVLVHAQDKLRDWRAVLDDAAASPGEPVSDLLERALNALFGEVDRLLAEVPARVLISLAPPAGEAGPVVRRDDAALAGKLAALEERVTLLENAAKPVPVTINVDAGQEYTLIKVNIDRLRASISGIIKIAGTIRTELSASLVDLGWLAELTKRVGELAAELKEDVSSAVQTVQRLAALVASVERVRRLAERVVKGGKTFLRFVRRALERRSGTGDGALTIGQVFRDVDEPWCPEMVVIPPGHFLMGSPDDEEGRLDEEGPRHEVRIDRRFALGRHAVTFAEYDAFCAATGRGKPGDAGWGRDRRPAINVSWEDAETYCAWLAEQTGKPYRLPSEAEWEYACRAGTATPFWWGATISTAQANYDGSYTYGEGKKGEYRRRTVPVDAPGFSANRFGLYHMHGNVREWVADCWHDDYRGAPSDGSPWIEEGCPSRAARGGSWNYNPRDLRAALRGRDPPGNRFDNTGFRVARMLTP